MIIKSNFIYSKDKDNMIIRENAYLVSVDGIIKGIYDQLPSEYADEDIEDYSDKIVIPGMNDIHLHAPQYPCIGLSMDEELLDWLSNTIFPQEAKYKDMEYANKAYSIFVRDLKNSVTTRACIFGTIHTDATLMLMRKLEESGLSCLVGKVNMDRNSPDYLCEEDVSKAKEDTKRFIEEAASYKNNSAILTPRFIPSCSDDMMKMVEELQREYNLPVQSHLSENQSEIEWVKDLVKESTDYTDAYGIYGLIDNDVKTVMAHCVYLSKEEMNRLRDTGVFIAHCPQSNANLSSGIAPVRKYLDMDINMGIGTDIAAGTSLSMFRAITDTVEMSKLYWRLVDNNVRHINFEEAFYMATAGGGSFFGRVGRFEEGYELDALVLDDSITEYANELDLKSRLIQTIYNYRDNNLSAKYVKGNKINLD